MSTGKRLFVLSVVLFLVVFYWGFYELGRQGGDAAIWKAYNVAKVTFDADGIPTIQGADWEKVTEAQGFVEASQRLWQMDLIRRRAAGRLGEWFGEAAFEHDKRVRLEGRDHVVRRSQELLPTDERRYCEAYSRGVNDFIDQHANAWGIEYRLMGVAPEGWRCADSLYAILGMAEILSSWSDRESKATLWAEKLPAVWRRFLFSQEHPWNRPLFDKDGTVIDASIGRHVQPDSERLNSGGPALPTGSNVLPRMPLLRSGEPGEAVKKRNGSRSEKGSTPSDTTARWAAASSKSFEVQFLKSQGVTGEAAVGSNSWAYRGQAGWWLANDPHLGQSVPGLWYALRLKISPREWVVGVSIPGVPGVVIGMTRHVAWSFTNSGEDVDDLLEERLSTNGERYLAKIDHRQQIGEEKGKGVWRPLVKRTFSIRVKGEEEARQVTGAFTHRGPLVQRPWLPQDKFYSRQWLPLKEGMLRIPSVQFAMAKSLEEFDQAVDRMLTPSQNIVSMDRSGRIRYRTSGVGIKRRGSGRWLQPAIAGEWLGFEPARARPRVLIELQQPSASLATANHRVWRDDMGHFWFSDDRQERIREVLENSHMLSQKNMEDLHMDTKSRFRRLLLRWVADHSSRQDSQAVELLESWKNWDGNSATDPWIFHQAGLVYDEIKDILVGQVKRHFLPNLSADVPYGGELARSWLLVVLRQPNGVDAFGITARELADELVARTLASPKQNHSEANRWRAQHPFVGRVPVIGRLFRIKEPPQWGAYDLVRAEKPLFGPSVRLIWNLQDPEKSSWAFPVGQSGHVASPWYRNFQDRWHQDVRSPVFPQHERHGGGWDFSVD